MKLAALLSLALVLALTVSAATAQPAFAVDSVTCAHVHSGGYDACTVNDILTVNFTLAPGVGYFYGVVENITVGSVGCQWSSSYMTGPSSWSIQCAMFGVGSQYNTALALALTLRLNNTIVTQHSEPTLVFRQYAAPALVGVVSGCQAMNGPTNETWVCPWDAQFGLTLNVTGLAPFLPVGSYPYPLNFKLAVTSYGVDISIPYQTNGSVNFVSYSPATITFARPLADILGSVLQPPELIWVTIDAGYGYSPFTGVKLVLLSSNYTSSSTGGSNYTASSTGRSNYTASSTGGSNYTASSTGRSNYTASSSTGSSQPVGPPVIQSIQGCDNGLDQCHPGDTLTINGLAINGAGADIPSLQIEARSDAPHFLYICGNPVWNDRSITCTLPTIDRSLVGQELSVRVVNGVGVASKWELALTYAYTNTSTDLSLSERMKQMLDDANNRIQQWSIATFVLVGAVVAAVLAVMAMVLRRFCQSSTAKATAVSKLPLMEARASGFGVTMASDAYDQESAHHY